MSTARAFDLLRQEACDEVAKPEWWNDEGLKALSASVLRAAPNDLITITMRAVVLSGLSRAGGAWKAGSRSATELKAAAVHFDRASSLCPAPAQKASLANIAGMFRHNAGLCAMQEI